MTDIKFIGTNQVELVNSLNGNKISPVSSGENFIEFSFNSLSKNDQDYYHFAITGSNVQLSGVIGEVTTKQQYFKLFEGCSAITDASQLQLTGTVMKESCYSNMFIDCVNLTTPPSTLPATTLALWCYSGMFAGCSSLSTAPTLPATTLAPYCYYAMFYGCSNLSTSPNLPAQTLVDWCYNSMFYNCSKLNEINCSFSAWNGNATSSWVTNIAARGQFNNDDVDLIYGDSNIPESWQIDYTPLTFKGLSSTNAIIFNKSYPYYQQDFKYKKNNNSWIDYNLGSIIELANGDTVSFSSSIGNFNDTYQFTMTGTIEADGNIMSLLNFSNRCTSQGCFYKTFENCSSLIKAPNLPATILTDNCYERMFKGCTNLTAAPKLPAKSATVNCYKQMFSGCTSLTQAPALPATTLAPSCYYDMFMQCSSLLTPPVLPTATLANNCYQGMFYNCYSLSAAPALPASTLSQSCYQGMFGGCISLSTAPALPATELKQYCYINMFNGCRKLSRIEVNFTDWVSSYTRYWVELVATSGTFIKPTALPLSTGIHYIPEGWTVLNK